MSYYLTFVAADPKAHPLTPAHFPKDVPCGEIIWLADRKAAETAMEEKPSAVFVDQLRDQLMGEKIDVFLTAASNRRKSLVIADMDSTIVQGETLDDLAGFAGIKDKIAQITKRAMAGELNFEDALNERVGLLEGLSEDCLNTALSHVALENGAIDFIQTMKKAGARCVLISGGFTFFTEAIAKQVGFDHHHGNILEIKDGALTGRVIPPILNKDTKSRLMGQYLDEFDLSADECLAIGDGANDIPMLKAAGLGIGFHPKDIVRSSVDNVILHGDLTTALYAQGFKDLEIVSN